MKKSYNILSYFNMRALFIGVGISRILSIAHEWHFISIIIGMFLGLLILKFVRIELKNNGINSLISSIFIILSLVIIINMISTMYLTRMTKFLIGLPIIIVIMYILKCKEIVIFRIVNILIVLKILFFIFCVVTLGPNIEISNLMYTGVGIKEILQAAIEFALISTVPTLISRYEYTSNIKIYKTYILSSLTILVISLIIYLIIGPDMSDLLRYPEYMVLKSINISNSITNLENMLSLIWVIDLMMLIVTCGNTIKRQVKKRYILNAILILLIIIVTFINKYYQLIVLVYNLLIPFLIISLILLYLINKKKKST